MTHPGAATVRNPYVSPGPTAEERERLIMEHLPQVRLIARRIHERLPESVSLEDLISTGIVGLISAIDRFDPLHNVKLKTYAEYKIRGASNESDRNRLRPPSPESSSARRALPRRKKSPLNLV
jgi:RNA polymerase sigma factor FliA